MPTFRTSVGVIDGSADETGIGSREDAVVDALARRALETRPRPRTGALLEVAEEACVGRSVGHGQGGRYQQVGHGNHRGRQQDGRYPRHWPLHGGQCDRPTDRPNDRPTDRPTDRPKTTTHTTTQAQPLLTVYLHRRKTTKKNDQEQFRFSFSAFQTTRQ